LKASQGFAGAQVHPDAESTESIAKCYWEIRRTRSNYLSFGGQIWQPVRTEMKPDNTQRRTLMKKLILAVALVVASAAPVMAEGFPNVYMTR
jgi:hypothetical protein